MHSGPGLKPFTHYSKIAHRQCVFPFYYISTVQLFAILEWKITDFLILF